MSTSGSSELAGLRALVISAPFGNYVQPAGATATLGTFTAAARPGRVRRVIATVRYYRRLRAWVNRIGLRNPGIDWLADRVRSGRIDPSDKLLSIHGFTADDWRVLIEKAAAIGPLGVELNMSCPNVGEVDWPDELFERATAALGERVVVKLPPVNYKLMFSQALAAGVRAFHCCNTLPVPAGGMSGKPLKPVALQCIREIREHLAGERAGELRLIGGGGITTPADIDDYAAAGAGHVAIGTLVMNPRYLLTYRPLRPLTERAEQRLGGGAAAAAESVSQDKRQAAATPTVATGKPAER